MPTTTTTMGAKVDWHESHHDDPVRESFAHTFVVRSSMRVIA
jgi:hypothetical protein